MMELKNIFEEQDEEDNLMAGVEEDAVESVVEELLDEVTLGLCFDVHRQCKMGTYMLDDTDPQAQKQYEIVNERGVDVFGQVPMKKQYECVCPSCQRNLAASRFAPHLEKCMGMGRNSSRIASRRIANVGKKDSDNESDGGDNDNDNDWSYMADKKAPAKKLKHGSKHSNSPRRTKTGKLSKNGSSGDLVGMACNTPESSSNTPTYELLSQDDRKSLLQTSCGVISEHTKKMCTRSVRCPQHTDEQRKSVRVYLLGIPLEGTDDVHIDIDTFDDSEHQSLRDALQWEAVSNPSPADSNSTTNSSSSRKRKHPKSKKKGSKSSNSNSSRGGTPTNVTYELHM